MAAGQFAAEVRAERLAQFRTYDFQSASRAAGPITAPDYVVVLVIWRPGRACGRRSNQLRHDAAISSVKAPARGTMQRFLPLVVRPALRSLVSNIILNDWR
eukprot:854038-Pyramimonas_sp.AAC.1